MRPRSVSIARMLGAIAALVVLVAACSSVGPAASSPPTPSASPIPSPSPLPPQTIRPDGSVIVHFDASDGVHLTGRIFGTGPTTVILAHMGNDGNSQDDWLPLVPKLVAKGVTVLTYNRRAICSGADECSQPIGGYGDSWHDIVGAVAYAKARGATKVIVGGASIGAMATLYAVLHEHLDVAGVVWFAGLVNEQGYSFEAAQVAGLSAPILIMAAKDDRGGAGADAQQLYGWAPQPKTLVSPPGRWHGTEVWTIDDPTAQQAITDAIVEFVAAHA
jgi:dienelactone hydrolase